MRSSLLNVRGDPPIASYAFKHALVQDTAYNSLLRTKRAELHAAIANVLKENFHEIASSKPELLAHHFTEAGLIESAIVQWHEAGRISIQRAAHREAIEYLRHGLDLLSELPETPERVRQELTLQMALGPAIMISHGWGSPEAAQCYARARELCLTVGDERELFPILWGFWMIHGNRQELTKWRETANEMLEIAQRHRDDAMLLQAHHASWGNSFQGNFSFQLEHIEQGLAIYDQAKHSSLAPQ